MTPLETLVSWGPVPGLAVLSLLLAILVTRLTILVVQQRKQHGEVGADLTLALNAAKEDRDRVLAMVERYAGAFERSSSVLDRIEETVRKHNDDERDWHDRYVGMLSEIGEDTRETRRDVATLLGRRPMPKA